VLSAFVCVVTQTGGGLLWYGNEPSRFFRKRILSLTAEWLLTSEESIRSVMLDVVDDDVGGERLGLCL
jgi:hypothetical protein